MFNIIIFLIGAGIMFYMAWRSWSRRRKLMTKGEKVEAAVAGTVQSRDGKAYLLEFTTAGGTHRLHYPKSAKGRELAQGAVVTLYYNPDDPAEMYVEGDKSVLGAEVLYVVLGVVLLAWAWVNYLRLDGVTIHHLGEEFKDMGKKKKFHSTKSIVDFADERIVSFEELEPEERTYCSMLSNLILGGALLIIGLIAGAV